jgi:hypothetical protein
MPKVKIFVDFFVNFWHLSTHACNILVEIILRRKIFMSNSNVIVSLIFEEMADEENLFTPGQQGFIAGLYRQIDDDQVKILEGIILSRAERLQCSSLLLRMAFVNFYQIDELKELPRDHFKEAIMYLTHFKGVN